MTLNILAVDDSRTMRDMLRLALSDAGYNVVQAVDGLHGLEVLDENEPDVIISDINMPNLDGFKFLEIINQKGVRAPLMFLTARADEEDEVKGLELGALDYLKKPIKKDALLMRVKRALGRRERA